MEEAVDHTFTREHGEGQGVDEDPADKVRQCGYGLNEFTEPDSLDLCQEDGEDHREPGEENAQSADAEGVLDDLKQLINLDLILDQGVKPFEADKR